MPISDANEKKLNDMCPTAKLVGLGSAIQDVVGGLPPDDTVTAAKLTTDAVETAKIKDDAVTKAKVAADVAGNGLGQNADGSLEVKVDDATLAIATDTLAVKDAGIVAAKLAADAVETAKIKDANVTAAKLAVALQAMVLGAAAGYKLARAETSVTGATGGDVTTGLTTVVAVVGSLAEDASVDGLFVTAALGGTAGHITLKVWKPTATGDVTPTLATVAKKVDWIAIGT
jgi:hypothetical protein